MAPKKSLLQDPPAASSSEDEEVESGEEDEEESGEEEEEEAGGEGQEDDEGESESDEEEPDPKKPDPVVSKPESSSSSGEDEDEDEDSDEDGSEKDDESESDEIPVKSKPIVAEEPKPKKTVSKPSSSTAPAIAVVPVSQKRPAETEQAENDSKKKKKADEANGEGGSGEKIDPKKLFARVWSDDDEVVILKGMMKWHEKGDDPFADLGGFLDFIKESVHAAVKQDQLLNKMRRLKKKYQNNFKRGKGGLDPIFSKPHDLKCYELMKVIWGGEEVSSRKKSAPADNSNEESAATANGKKSRSSKPKTATPASPKHKTVALSDISSKELPKEVQEVSASAYPLLAAAFADMKNSPTLGESLFKEGLALLGDSKAKEMENRWRKLHQEEAEVYLKRVELVGELTATVLNAMKSYDA